MKTFMSHIEAIPGCPLLGFKNGCIFYGKKEKEPIRRR
jgi:hypothetical protein